MGAGWMGWCRRRRRWRIEGERRADDERRTASTPAPGDRHPAPGAAPGVGIEAARTPLTAPFVHPTAEVEASAVVGAGARIWRNAHVRAGARIGAGCIVGKDVFVDAGVVVGDRCKLQNGALVFRGATLEDGVFVGPGAIVTNDRLPRAVNPDGSLKSEADWAVAPTRVGRGASLGAGSVVVAGVTIGAWAMVGAGAVVTRDVPDHGLVVGNPARLVGYVCRCGRRAAGAGMTCGGCGAGG